MGQHSHNWICRGLRVVLGRKHSIITLRAELNTSGQERLTNEAIIATIERGHGVGELVGATVTMQISGTVTEDTVP